MPGATSTRRSPARNPTTEWIAAGLGLALLIASLGFTFTHAMWGDHSAPTIRVRVESISPTGAGYRVEFVAENTGGRPARDIVIDAQLTPTTGDQETATVTLDYLAGHSKRRGGVFLSSDPRSGQFEIQAQGYQVP